MDSIGEKRAGGKTGVGVLDKAVGILSLLAEGGPAPLAGVVRGTGLARPTAYRLWGAPGGGAGGSGGRGWRGRGPTGGCRRSGRTGWWRGKAAATGSGRGS